MNLTPHFVPTLLFFAATTAHAQAAAVPHLDFARFSGSWYKIAEYPDKKEKSCAADQLIMFTRGDKPTRFQVVDSCNTRDDTGEARNLTGKPQDRLGDGELKVGSFWPFYSKYWVLALASDYDWALVGNPNHKSLVILSRKTTLDPAALAEAKSKASAAGFDPAKLILLKQGQ